MKKKYTPKAATTSATNIMNSITRIAAPTMKRFVVFQSIGGRNERSELKLKSEERPATLLDSERIIGGET